MADSWRSSLEIHDLASGTNRVVLRSPDLIEAPNWHPDGWLMVNGGGRLWRVPLDAPRLEPIDTGACDRCNNDHGFLPDGRIVLTHHTGAGAAIFAMREGSPPVPLVTARPSWWHGATAAGGGGMRIAYAAARDDRRVVGLCEMDLATGAERRLTDFTAACDGPDYAPCGRVIWFNSAASGHAQIWRIGPDGPAVQAFADDRVNWFPHPSPCGGHVLYLAYPPGTEGHPRDLEVGLWLMRPDGGNRRQVVALFGGQGSINVPCWAPDGGAFAFMRYAPIA